MKIKKFNEILKNVYRRNEITFNSSFIIVSTIRVLLGFSPIVNCNLQSNYSCTIKNKNGMLFYLYIRHKG